MFKGVPERSPNLAALTRVRRVLFAGYSFLATSMEQIASFVITLMAASFLVPAEYGVYTLGIVFISLIQAMGYTGFYQFVVTSSEDDDSVLSTSFWLIFGLSAAASALLIALAIPIAHIYRAPDLGNVIILLALMQPVAGINAWYSAALLRRRAVKLNFTVNFLASAASLVGGVIVLWATESLYALVAYRYLRVLIAAALFFVLSRLRPSLAFNRLLARRAAGFSGGLYGARFLDFLSKYSADLLLGLMFTTAEAGLFRFGSRIAGGATDIVALPMRSFTLTQFGHAARSGGDLSRLLERFTGSITMLTGGVAAVIVVFADDAVAAFFNPAYQAAVPIAAAIAVRGVVHVGALMLDPTMSARGQTGAVMRFVMIWSVIGVVAIFISAPYGLAVLAWTTAAVTGASTLWALHVISRVGGVAVGGALRALILAAALAIGYGLVIEQCSTLIAVETDLSEMAKLTLGLAVSTLLAVPTLLIARWLKVFSLHVFSG